MGKFSKVWSIVLCAVLAWACVVPAMADSQAETKTESLNIMLMVDDTVSMQLNDPNHIASLALQKFVDRIPSEGSYIGMATYDDDILTRVPEDRAMQHIRGDEDKKVLRRYAETGLTQDGRFTDLPRALYYAVEQIQTVGETENKPAIIAVSDGENDYLNEAARQRSEGYLEKVYGAGIPVYLMVINASNESGVREYMEKIAEKTGGEAYFIQSGDEIDVRLEVLAEELYGLIVDPDNMLDTTVGPESADWPFSLEDGIFEANLELTHSTRLDMELIGPDGTQIPLSGNDSVIVTTLQDRGASKTTVRLIEPEQGGYTMRLSSPDQQLVVGKIILNKEIYILVELSPDPVVKGQPAQVTAKLMRGGEQYTDLEFVNLTASMSVDGGSATGMDQDNASGTFRAELPALASGTYSLVVTVQGKSFFRNSDPVEIVVQDGGQMPGPTASNPIETETPTPEPAPGSTPLWPVIGAAAALVVIVLAVILFVLRRRPRSRYIRLQGTLTVTYLDDVRQYIWERYVQPGRYYTPRGPASLGKMLRDQQNYGDIPAWFDQIQIAGVQYGEGRICVEVTGEFAGGEKVNNRIEVSTGGAADEFDSFDDMSSTLIVFPDGTQAELSFTIG